MLFLANCIFLENHLHLHTNPLYLIFYEICDKNISNEKYEKLSNRNSLLEIKT